MKFKEYVGRRRVPKGKDFNFQSLTSGLFQITSPNEFFKLFHIAYPKMNNKTVLPLVFRPRPDGPFYLDVDLRVTESCRIPDEVFVEMAHHFLTTLKTLTKNDDIWDVYLTRRAGSYPHTSKKFASAYASGFHMIIPNLNVNKAFMQRFYTDVTEKELDWLSLLGGFTVLNQPSDIIDKKVCLRTNGLLLLGLNKPGLVKRSPHYLFNVGSWRTDWFENQKILPFGWQFKSVDANVAYKTMVRNLYSWVFEYKESEKPVVPVPVQVVQAIKQPVARVPQPVQPQPVQADATFDLDYFLSCCEGSASKFDHDMWLPLLWYCRKAGLKKAYVCDKLNAYFRPHDNEENARVWENFRLTKCNTNAGSIVEMLRRFATKEYDTTRVFPRQAFQFHNESDMFLDNPKI